MTDYGADVGGSGSPFVRKGIVPNLFMWAFLIYFALPLFWLIVASTKTNSSLFSSAGFWFAHPFNLAENIRGVFSYDNGVFTHWLINSAIYAVVSAGGAAVLATLAGYGFARYEFSAKRMLFGTVLCSIMVPATALAVPTYLLFSKIGFVDNPLSVIVPSLVSPFGIYLMRIYAEQAVPQSLIDSARIDGAGELVIFARIASRLLAPAFVTVVLFTLVATWNNYFLPLVMLSNPKYYPLTVGLAQEYSLANAGGGVTLLDTVVIAGSLISIIPLVAAFLLLQRFWQSGLSAGSVKE